MYCTMKCGSVSEKKCNNITQLYRVKIQPAMCKKYDMIVNFSKLISILKDLCNGF